MQLRHITLRQLSALPGGKEKGDYRILQWTRGYITERSSLSTRPQGPGDAPILGDKRFRWALSLGINREEIIEAVYLGMAEPSQVSPLTSSPFYWEEQAKDLIGVRPGARPTICWMRWA